MASPLNVQINCAKCGLPIRQGEVYTVGGPNVRHVRVNVCIERLTVELDKAKKVNSVYEMQLRSMREANAT